MPGILSQAVISQDKIPGISERNMKLFKYLHIFYLLVLSEEREELLPEELRRLSELRTLEAFLFPCLPSLPCYGWGSSYHYFNSCGFYFLFTRLSAATHTATLRTAVTCT